MVLAEQSPALRPTSPATPVEVPAPITPVAAAATPRAAHLPISVPQPWRVTRWLALTVGLLVVASSIGQAIRLRLGYTYAAGLIPLFYVDDEANVPTWYSSMTLLLAAALLLLIATTVRSRGDRTWRQWAALSAVFAALSLDEVAQIHELLIAPLRGRVGGADGYLYYPWVIPGAIFALAVAVAFARFLYRLPATTRTLFIVAGLVYVGGALGVETITARLDFEYGPADIAYVVAATLEETLEMAAIVVFLHALIAYLRQLAVSAAGSGGELRR